MLVHILVGVAITAVFWFIVSYTQKNNIQFSWWQWALTFVGLAYTTFVLEVIIGFMLEGAPRAALVNGMATGIVGIVGIVFWVLWGRFIIAKAIPAAK